ncbi:hypothetical protein PR002_g11422 [Phytophthora rubi]|uniref:Retrovirus-related Pol polyprotein from transposon TNT 1-94-like beta-barrel domain-containing protein n=1 Tax=Phytophthora rubi TaxID=129364 RepID=A0A6A3M8D2_9STRA|nr:hypothetical protein PR002_g11422 [Phytophthora rubi]
MLRPDEPVREYIADLLKMQRELAENNDPISDSRLAKIMLTKAHTVNPVIADEVTEKLRRDPGYKYTVRDARGRLENTEIQRAQRDPVSGGATSSRGLSTHAQANAVQQHRNNGKQPCRSSSRQRGGKYGGNKSSGSSTSRSSWSGERMSKKKKSSKCNACGEKGHWRGDPECKQGKLQTLCGTGDQAVQPFGGAVLRQQAPHRSQDRVVECMTSRADDEVGSNETCIASSQSLTMADVLAVLGPQAAKQMQKKLQARSSASGMPARALSPQYSPTSPPSSPVATSTQYSPTTPASPDFEVNAAVVQRDQRVPAMQADEMEWLLDSGSQVNLCGDLACFSYIERGSSSNLLMACGQTEAMQASGSVVFRVTNGVSGQWEPRRLDEVHYSPNARVNLIRIGYMRACGFKLEFNDDQSTAWLCKGGLKLRFDCHDMLYRMRVKWSVRLVGAVEQRKNAMGLLHNRIGHVNMKLIRELASRKVDFGLNVNMQSLKDYECVPCLSAKFKRTTYKRGPNR